jgi:carbamoyl-phosphate synthase small subunit
MQAYLILANGMVFAGKSIGRPGTTLGEVVFATGMVGFEETLTDPSYYGQIITQTYPMIGNYGMNHEDKESGKIWAKGYIVREACTAPSNFRCEETLDTFLKENGIIGIEGIDTRCLTRTLRESGVMNGIITTELDPAAQPEKLAAWMPRIAAYAVTNAVKSVSCIQPVEHNPGGAVHVALLDLGCKNNIVRCLVKRGCHVTVVPGTASPEQVAALHADGLMLSNGPGDPAENAQVIKNIAAMLDTGIPTFGICLGHQLTALAAGAKTRKMKYGHRGANQPVTELATGRTYITSQNHGYAVMGETLSPEVGTVSHVNANDHSCEGVIYKKWNCFTVQFHPEASGGPRDTEFLFDRFLANIRQAKEGC